jgi:ABC-type antimicrobial peptide transport system permease subunit
MGAILLVVRAELRGRARSLAGLTLIVALVAAVVLAALVGARRTGTTLERFREESRSSHAYVQVNDLDPEVAERVTTALDDLPMVEIASPWFVSPSVPIDGPTDTADFALLGDPLGRYGVEIDRPRVVEGRPPDPAAIDEVMLTTSAARVFDLGTGDTMVVQTFSPDDLTSIVTGAEFPGFNGPEVELEVVGVGLWPQELNDGDAPAVLAGLVSPAFVDENRTTVGSWPSAQVRLREGFDDIAALSDDVRQLAGTDAEVIVTSNEDIEVAPVQSTLDVMATALTVFAAVAALAGLVAVGQAVSRQVMATAGVTATLGALGFSTRERSATLFASVALAAGIGTILGAIGAVALSPLLPFGTARRAEPDAGLWVDPLVLATVGIGFFGLVCLWALVVTHRAARRFAGRTALGPRPSRIAAWLARSGMRPAPVTGVRFAYEAGAGRTAVPVRAAIAGGAMGVAGVVAVAVVLASLSNLTATPSNWGWNWSSRPDIYGDVDATLGELAEDERLDAIAGLSTATVDIGGEETWGYAIEAVKGSIPFTILDGRAPVNRQEVALGARTLAALDLSVGDTARFADPERTGEVELEVVGVLSTPLVESTDPGRGAVLTPDGLDAVRQSDGSEQLLLRYHDGVDAVALEDELVDTAGLAFPIYARSEPPGEVANLDQVKGVMLALAAFFALLGTIGVAHALAVSVRRRRPDLGVLRVLGLTRIQGRGTVRWQSVTIAVTSAAIGTPIGLILGRAVWSGLVGDMGVIDDPTQPWVVLALVLPVSLVLALVAGWIPSRNAVRLSPAAALRAE